MVTKAYAMMLLVMTYNYPILIMLVAGLATGYFIFQLIGLPELPFQYKQIAGSGAYLPDCDQCCTKVEEEHCACPSQRRQNQTGEYQNLATNDMHNSF